MLIDVITDTHLGHEKLKTMGQGRPDDFTYRVLQGLELSRNADLLIHLGDVCIGNEDYYHRLIEEKTRNYKKRILIRGNHDNKSDAWYYARGWDFICREFSNKYYGKAIVFSHAPIPLEYITGYDYNVHGHYHGAAENSHRHAVTMLGGGTYDQNIHRDAAPELHGYNPINLEKLIK